jgi:hypothetical protein
MVLPYKPGADKNTQAQYCGGQEEPAEQPYQPVLFNREKQEADSQQDKG